MAEIDLIPADYRARLARLSWLRNFALVTGGILMVSGAAWSALGVAVQAVNGEVEDLRTGKALVVQRRAELDKLVVARDENRRRLKNLETVHNGLAGEKMFLVIDRALPGKDVWFQSWEFHQSASPGVVKGTRRAASLRRAGGSPNPGHGDEDSRMAILGQARDYTALSRFVDGLLEQPEIRDVRVVNTARHSGANQTVVDFEVGVLVRLQDGE